MSPSRLHGSLIPLVLLATGPASRCELSTASGTGELRLVGTVRFLEVEGGCWQLSAQNGRTYELQPGQAPPSLLVNAARVSVVARLSEGSETGCQVGMPIDVRRVVSVALVR